MDISCYTKKLTLKAEHVDLYRRLKLTELMRLFQECCIAHTEELGMGRQMTLDRGFLWVVLSERILIDRLPEYDEDITIECTPGETLHFFFPRNMVVRDSEGNVLVRVKAMWGLLDRNTRQMIDPSEEGIYINGRDLPTDIAPMMSFIIPELPFSMECKAQYSLVDINGHLNNASYLSLALDRLWEEDNSFEGKIKEISMLFRKEIPFKSEFNMKYGKVDGKWYFHCPNYSLRLVPGL